MSTHLFNNRRPTISKAETHKYRSQIVQLQDHPLTGMSAFQLAVSVQPTGFSLSSLLIFVIAIFIATRSSGDIFLFTCVSFRKQLMVHSTVGFENNRIGGNAYQRIAFG